MLVHSLYRVIYLYKVREMIDFLTWSWDEERKSSILTPRMNQVRISPYNINALPSRQVMSIDKNINYRGHN